MKKINREAALTHERLKQVLQYLPDTGVFIQKERTSRRVKVGDVAGTTRKDGYVIIRIDGDLYRAHRLAWLYMKGRWPSDQIDHIDRNPSNNRFSNLRECNQSLNNQNQGLSRRNKSGKTGVCFDSLTRNWKAEICRDGSRIFLGRFPTKSEAVLTRLYAESRQLIPYPANPEGDRK